jgi:SAM-dependent methyltransferase
MAATILDRLFSNRRHRLGRRFDRLNGVETSGIIRRDAFTSMPLELRAQAGDYVPSDPSLIRRIVRWSGVDPSVFTFVDLGCGKGRAIIAAAEFPFNALVGIEADAGLCAIADRNLGLCRRPDVRHRTIILNSDARTFDVPEGNLFVFMYAPFHGAIFEAVAGRLTTIASEPDRAVVIAYSADWEGDLLERTGRFIRRRLPRKQFWAPSSVSLFYNEHADRMRRRLG